MLVRLKIYLFSANWLLALMSEIACFRLDCYTELFVFERGDFAKGGRGDIGGRLELVFFSILKGFINWACEIESLRDVLLRLLVYYVITRLIAAWVGLYKLLDYDDC